MAVNDKTHPNQSVQVFNEIAEELRPKGFTLTENKRILFYEGTNNSIPIARYTNMAQLVHILSGEMSFSKRLLFSDRTELGDYLDPRLMVINQVTGIGGRRRNEYIKRKREKYKSTLNFYASCWTMKEHESFLMWKAYSPTDSGVMVTSTINGLLEHFDIPDDSFLVCGPIFYTPKEIDKRSYKDILFTKNIGYKDEQEYRFYYISNQYPDNSKYKYVNVNIDSFTEIVFSPLYGSDNMREHANMLMKLCGDHIQTLYKMSSVLESR